MSKQVLGVLGDAVHRPVFIEVGGRATPVDLVEQKVLPVNSEQKLDLLVQYVLAHKPDRTLVFTRTKHRAERLALTLGKRGIRCSAIHGNRNQQQREKALEGFRAGRIKVLVATDVVARGIDVEGISHVINYDMPANPEDYVHRIGRTARAGASGMAVSLLTRRRGLRAQGHRAPDRQHHRAPRPPGLRVRQALYPGVARPAAAAGQARLQRRCPAGDEVRHPSQDRPQVAAVRVLEPAPTRAR